MLYARSMRRESVMKLVPRELSSVSGLERLLSKNMSSLVEGKSFSINNFSENLSSRIFQNFSDNAASLREELDFSFNISCKQLCDITCKKYMY